VINEVGGHIVVQGSRAIGWEFNGGGAPIINHGYLEVDGGAPGSLPAAFGITTIQNVQSVVVNTGQIIVHGTDGGLTSGLTFGFGSFTTLTNSGLIEVLATTNNAASLAIGYSSLNAQTIINQGTITAGIAIAELTDPNSGPRTDGVNDTHVINSGTITGDIKLNEGNDSVVNTGTITGNVYLGDLVHPHTDYGDENDLFQGQTGTFNGSVDGGAGNDVIYTGSGDSTLLGSDGNDVLGGGPGSDTLNGGAGSDTASYLYAAAAVTVSLAITIGQAVGGGEGTDTFISIENLEGSNFNDTLTGDGGNNVLTGGGGDDLLNGGLGSDTASYHDAAGAVMASLLIAGPQAVGGGAGSDTFVSIESLEGSVYNDTLTGDGGDNVLSGLGGNDLLIGGAGNDTFDGGAGIDTVSYDGATSAVTVNLSVGSAQNVGGGQGSDTFTGIEAIQGSQFDDTLTGDSNDNIFIGGKGNDTLNGSSGNDTASYVDATSAVSVDLNLAGQAQAVGGGDGSDTLNSIENLTGSNFNDTLLGNGGNNVLEGGKGDDLLNGGGGLDTASYAHAASGVTVDLNIAGSQNVGGGEGTDTLVSIENVIGSEFDDVLTAGTATTIVMGGGGNDLLAGHLTGQTLDGGAGSDTVDYSGVSGRLHVDLTIQSGVSNVSIPFGGGIEVLLNVENVKGGAFGDSFIGNEADNTFWGNGGDDSFVMERGGNDTVFGGDGDDTIGFADGFTGSDTVDGGAGNDTLELVGGKAPPQALFSPSTSSPQRW
jgi:Ca2+-binding RTX toxin-like protein